MSSRSAVAPPPVLRDTSLTWRELLWAGMGILAGVVLLVVVSQSSFLIVRKFWLDEVCTWILVTDPSVSHAMDALLHGVDANPPGLHLILRGLHALGMPADEAWFHLVSGVAAVLGMLGVYGTLRRTFDRATSAAATCFLLTGYTFVSNVFEARFYAPWFAVTAWFCFALGALVRRPGVGNRSAVAMLSVLMLTIHYFGLFTFLLIVGVDFLADRRPFWSRLAIRWPLLACVPALALVLYFYHYQSRALTVKSWIAGPTLANSGWFLAETLDLAAVGCLAAALAFCWIFRRKIPLWKGRTGESMRPIAGLLAAGALPLALAAFSRVILPVEVPRYALPAYAGVGAAAAMMLSRMRPAAVYAVAAMSLVVAGFHLHRRVYDYLGPQDELRAYGRIVAEARPGELVVFERRHALYPMVLANPALRRQFYLLDFEVGQEPEWVLTPSPAFCIIERDEQRIVSHYYPEFQRIFRSHLPRGEAFLFISDDQNVARIQARFPGARVRLITGRMYEIVMAGGQEPGRM